MPDTTNRKCGQWRYLQLLSFHFSVHL